MQGNDASFYARQDSSPTPSAGDSSYASPSSQMGSNAEYKAVSSDIDKPIDYAGLGLKARQIAQGGGPLQPPIGQTIHGSIQDVKENTTLGDWGTIIGGGLGLAGLAHLWNKATGGGNNPPNTPPNNPPGPVAPTEPSPIELERLKREQLRTQREELRLQAEQDKIARANAQYEANKAAAEAKAAAAQKQSSGKGLSPQDAQMLAASETAKVQKAIDADIKAQKANQAVAQTTTAQAATSPVVENAAAPVVEAPAAVAPAPVEELRTGTGKPAFAGQAEPTGKFKSSYKDVSEVPKGYAFVPGGQQVDALRNALGQEAYTQQFSKREWPTQYAGPEGSEQVAKEINKSLGRPTREEALAQGIPKEKIGEPTPGISRKVNNKSLVKVGGVAGALIAIPSLSQAAQEKDFGKAADILTDFLVPMFGQSSVAGMPRKQEEAIIAEKFKEAQKLGSPYRSVPPPKR